MRRRNCGKGHERLVYLCGLAVTLLLGSAALEALVIGRFTEIF